MSTSIQNNLRGGVWGGVPGRLSRKDGDAAPLIAMGQAGTGRWLQVAGLTHDDHGQ